MIYISSITNQGQLTIPMPIRQKLNLMKSSKALVIEIPNQGFLIKPMKNFDQVTGLLQLKKPIKNLDEVISKSGKEAGDKNYSKYKILS